MDTDLSQSARQKVLVVDDCPNIRALIKLRLKDEPLDLHFAACGVEGLGICRSLVPDLVLLDLDMPDIDGPEVLKRLKSDASTVNIPVIFLTGESSTHAKVNAFDLGAADYVTKPFDATELRARVRAALRTKYLVDLLAQKAMIDGLTGLWNRAYFNERIEAEIALARRSGTQVSLIMADVDHFKKLNDSYGHPFGDEVLRAVARATAARLRVSDIACRYGGEEFAILLPNTDGPRAVLLAEDLRELLVTLRFPRGQETVRVTASFGVADLARDQDAATLVQNADQALYNAKHAGRNRVSLACAPTAQGVQIPSVITPAA